MVYLWFKSFQMSCTQVPLGLCLVKLWNQEKLFELFGSRCLFKLPPYLYLVTFGAGKWLLTHLWQSKANLSKLKKKYIYGHSS